MIHPFQPFQLFQTPAGREILLLKEVQGGADATWLAMDLTKGERAICCNRFLRGCRFMMQMPRVAPAAPERKAIA